MLSGFAAALAFPAHGSDHEDRGRQHDRDRVNGGRRRANVRADGCEHASVRACASSSHLSVHGRECAYGRAHAFLPSIISNKFDAALLHPETGRWQWPETYKRDLDEEFDSGDKESQRRALVVRSPTIATSSGQPPPARI